LVEGKYVPVSHCAVVLEMKKWRSVVKRLKQHRGEVFHRTLPSSKKCSRRTANAVFAGSVRQCARGPIILQ
jgi:extradiol dioxygenase family protein